MNIIKQFQYIFFGMDNKIGFKIKYFFEKFIRFIFIYTNKIFRTNINVPYIFKTDYIIKNKNGIWKIKAKSDYDFTINTNTESDIEEAFQINEGIFIDIGAHIGKWSIFVAKQSPKIKVYAFEPNPESFQYLKENIKLNQLEDRIIPMQLGVGAKKDTLSFYAEKERSTISCFSKNGNIKVGVVDLESFLLENKIEIEQIRLIKIDTEGFESQVFEGMKNILPKFKNIKIICELLPEQTNKNEIIDNMKSIGFQAQTIGESHNYLFTS